jgi:ribonuclease BN (tRNA processing enzyme)
MPAPWSSLTRMGFSCKMTPHKRVPVRKTILKHEVDVKIILLGTGGFLPTDSAQTACYFLPEVGVMLDAGSGTFHLPKYLQRPELDIYLSHAHGDHTSGLTYLFAAYLKADWLRRGETLSADNIADFVQRANEALPHTRIHADENTQAFVQPIFAYLPYEWHLLQTQEPLPGGGTLTHFLMDGGTVGFRLDWPGHSLAYITDVVARPDSAYIEKIKGVNLLLHDCNGPDHLSDLTDHIGHSHLSAVLQVAALAQVKRLVLIHSSPIEPLDYSADFESARPLFPATEIGYDGMELDF